MAMGRRGKVKGVSLNPVTAVAYKLGKGVFASNKRGTTQAGKALGLTKTFTENLYQATTNQSNRGHSQVVRGKIRSALEI
jgi:phage-related tail protein